MLTTCACSQTWEWALVQLRVLAGDAECVGVCEPLCVWWCQWAHVCLPRKRACAPAGNREEGTVGRPPSRLWWALAGLPRPRGPHVQTRAALFRLPLKIPPPCPPVPLPSSFTPSWTPCLSVPDPSVAPFSSHLPLCLSLLFLPSEKLAQALPGFPGRCSPAVPGAPPSLLRTRVCQEASGKTSPLISDTAPYHPILWGLNECIQAIELHLCVRTDVTIKEGARVAGTRVPRSVSEQGAACSVSPWCLPTNYTGLQRAGSADWQLPAIH